MQRQPGEEGGEAGWAPNLLQDSNEAATAVAVPVDGGDFGGPAQCGGSAAGESAMCAPGLDENRAGSAEELAGFEPTAATATAVPVGDGGGGAGLGDMLCDGGGLGVDGDSGLGDEGGGLDDGLGGL